MIPWVDHGIAFTGSHSEGDIGGGLLFIRVKNIEPVGDIVALGGEPSLLRPL